MSWIFVLGFLFVAGVARGVYEAHAVDPSTRFSVLEKWGLGILVWYWVKAHGRPRRLTYPLDFGWFMITLWPFLAPYYLWRAEGWRGLGKFALLVVCWVLSYALSVVAYGVLTL